MIRQQSDPQCQSVIFEDKAPALGSEGKRSKTAGSIFNDLFNRGFEIFGGFELFPLSSPVEFARPMLQSRSEAIEIFPAHSIFAHRVTVIIGCLNLDFALADDVGARDDADFLATRRCLKPFSSFSWPP